MQHDSYSDDYLRDILNRCKTFAMVGASANWNKASYFVMKYMQKKGYRVIPVNPKIAGDTILGERVYPDLASIPEPYSMVDIFRNSEAAGHVTNEALALAEDKGIQMIWMQLTVINEAAAQRAEAQGLDVVMNRCPKQEFSRLHGEYGWSGMTSGIITSKRRKL